MILCVFCDNKVVGKVISTSIGISGDQNDDWNVVVKFLRILIPKFTTGGSKFDSEIANLIDVLESDRVTDDEVVEHIALWLTPRWLIRTLSMRDDSTVVTNLVECV